MKEVITNIGTFLFIPVNKLGKGFKVKEYLELDDVLEYSVGATIHRIPLETDYYDFICTTGSITYNNKRDIVGIPRLSGGFPESMLSSLFCENINSIYDSIIEEHSINGNFAILRIVKK